MRQMRYFFSPTSARLLRARIEPLDPVPQRLRIMRAQAFDVDAFEVLARHQLDFLRPVRDFAAGKDINSPDDPHQGSAIPAK